MSVGHYCLGGNAKKRRGEGSPTEYSFAFAGRQNALVL